MSRESDRDRLIEQLLSRAPGPGAGATGACVDAERFAAWADGGLPRAEAMAIEAHLADCPQCRAMAAAFAAVGPQAVHEERAWWRRPLSRWVLPVAAVGAAAAVLLIFQSRPPAPPASELAKLQTPAPRRDAAPAPLPENTPAQAAPARERAAEGRASAQLDAVRNAPGKSPESRRETAAAPLQQASRQIAEPAAKPAPAPEVAAAASPSIVSEFTAGTSTADAQTNATRRVVGRNEPSLAKTDAATAEKVSASPTPRWRILRSGGVERSVTDGATWEAMAIDPPVFVTAGVAPGPAVCWLAGRQGAVLLSRDGVHFSRVSVPAAIDLVSIEATDATHAAVSTADGRTFTTADAGQSWQAPSAAPSRGR